jgi:hypothetical protein
MMSLRKIIRTGLILFFGSLICQDSGRSEGPAPAQALPAPADKPRVTASFETTVLLEPLRPDGCVDYVAVLNQRMSKGVTLENNAAIPLLRVTGSKILGKHAERYCEMLGIPLVPQEGVIKPTEFEVPQGQLELRETRRNEFDFVISHPWKASEYPVLARWLNQHESQLDSIAQAAEKSHFYTPLIPEDVNHPSVISILLPQAQVMRDLSWWISIRCMFRLEQGQLRDAIADVRTLHHLARLQGQGQTLIEGIVSLAIEGIARTAAKQILLSSDLTPELAAELQREVGSWSQLVSPADTMDAGDRWMFLDSVCGLARDPEVLVLDDEKSQAELRKLALVNGAIDEALKVGNRRFDKIVFALRLKTPAQRWTALQQIAAEIQQLQRSLPSKSTVFTYFLGSSKSQGQLLGEMMIACAMPAFSQVELFSEKSQSNTDLLKVAIAIRRYQLDQGEYPQSLVSLIPKYLSVLPVDRMTGEPLRYYNGGSAFRISSSGQDGVEEVDLSQPLPAEPPRRTSDDLVLEFELPLEPAPRR